MTWSNLHRERAVKTMRGRLHKRFLKKATFLVVLSMLSLSYAHAQKPGDLKLICTIKEDGGGVAGATITVFNDGLEYISKKTNQVFDFRMVTISDNGTRYNIRLSGMSIQQGDISSEGQHKDC